MVSANCYGHRIVFFKFSFNLQLHAVSAISEVFLFPSVMYEKVGSLVENLILSWNDMGLARTLGIEQLTVYWEFRSETTE